MVVRAHVHQFIIWGPEGEKRYRCHVMMADGALMMMWEGAIFVA